MTEVTQTQPPGTDRRNTSPTPDELSSRERIVVRHYPKIITTFPLTLTAFLCAALSGMFGDSQVNQEWIATFFFVVLSLNLIILSLEFPRMTALFAATLVALVVVVILWLKLWIWILAIFSTIHWSASPQFYLAVGLVFLAIYGIVLAVSRFDYWEFTPNDVTHYYGPFADTKRYPAPGLRVDKEIADITEYLILRGGRLILRPSSEHEAVVIEIVLNVKQVEREIKHLLRAMEVRVEPEHAHNRTHT